MYYHKKLVALAIGAGVAIGASACSSATGDQRAAAINELHNLGFTHVVDEGGSAPPFGTGEMYFTADLPRCHGRLVGLQPGSTSVHYEDVNAAEFDAVMKQAHVGETFADAMLRLCGAAQLG